jgi:hypothetical protein
MICATGGICRREKANGLWPGLDGGCRSVMSAIENCRTAELGGHVVPTAA